MYFIKIVLVYLLLISSNAYSAIINLVENTDKKPTTFISTTTTSDNLISISRINIDEIITFNIDVNMISNSSNLSVIEIPILSINIRNLECEKPVVIKFSKSNIQQCKYKIIDSLINQLNAMNNELCKTLLDPQIADEYKSIISKERDALLEKIIIFDKYVAASYYKNDRLLFLEHLRHLSSLEEKIINRLLDFGYNGYIEPELMRILTYFKDNTSYKTIEDINNQILNENLHSILEEVLKSDILAYYKSNKSHELNHETSIDNEYNKLLNYINTKTIHKRKAIKCNI